MEWGCGEMADTADLKSASSNGVGVRVPPSPPLKKDLTSAKKSIK